MTKMINRFKGLSIKNKIQFIIASLLTLIVSIPVYAWFNHNRKIAELQKIKSPDLLYISAACAEDVRNFDISMIKISDKEGAPTSQMFPFAVAGEYLPTFTLQFSHTTNNPFDYKIYEGVILSNNEGVCKSKAAAQSVFSSLSPSGDFDSEVIEYKTKAPWSNISNLDRSNDYHIDTGDTVYITKRNDLFVLNWKPNISY